MARDQTAGRRWTVALIMAALTAGCDSIFDTAPDRAENAHVRVTGSSPVPLQLILSNRFQSVPDPGSGQFITELLEADTFELQLPIERTYPLGDAARIFVRLNNRDSTQTADVTMRILLDDREVYEQTAKLRNAYLEYTFTYR